MEMDIEAARRYFQQREQQRREERETVRQQWLQRVHVAVATHASHYPGVVRVYLFGSLTQPGRFRTDSDIDLAVECDTLEIESAFWRALEHALQRDVDMRPLDSHSVLFEMVRDRGQKLYERHDPRPDK